MIQRASAGSGTAEGGVLPDTSKERLFSKRSGPRGKSGGRGGLPVVAIVGRPNVGKSTLFNRLVGRRQAIVQDTPGVTRDRILGLVEWGERRFQLVDTGGLEPVSVSAGLTGKIRSQIEKAFAQADLFLFVVDGQGPLLPRDEEIARDLRKRQKPVVCVVNKIDAGVHGPNVYPFYRLGFDPLFPVSSEHGVGFSELLDHLDSILPHTDGPADSAAPGDSPTRIAVVGRPNVGKSTLVNTLLGEERQIVDAEPGTTRDAVDSFLRRGGRDFVLMDTAGIRRRGRVRVAVEKFSVIKALESLDRCEVAMLLLDASQGVTDQDAHIGGYIVDRGRGVVVLLNKWDLVGGGKRKVSEVTRAVRDRLGHLQFAPILPLSATRGTNVDQALAAAVRVREAFYAEAPTGPLNRVLEEAVREHPPPAEGGKARKFYYITQVRRGPPTFLLFTNFSGEIHFSYQRYLLNRLRARFGFEGAPIRLMFRQRR